MKKKAIEGSSSTDDAQTFYLKNSREVFDRLASVFDFEEDFDEALTDTGWSRGLYDLLLNKGWYLSHFERENSHIYVFLAPSVIYLLIRRTGNFEKLVKKLLDHFEYMNSKPKDSHE